MEYAKMTSAQLEEEYASVSRPKQSSRTMD